MKKIKFVAVVGRRNSGKSTVIQSLTGCRTRGFVDFVVDEDTQNSVYVIASSPQEQDPANQNSITTIDDLQDVLSRVVNRQGCLGIVMAIQPDMRHRRVQHISMEDIFNLVRRIGRFEEFVFVLHPGRNNQNVVNVQQINARLGIVSHVLNAQKFSHFNACEIQNISNLLA